MDNVRHIFTDMGVVYPDLHPYTVKGWMKTTVSGPRNRFVDMELRFIVVDLRTGKKVANAKGYATAFEAWTVCHRISKSDDNRATLPA